MNDKRMRTAVGVLRGAMTSPKAKALLDAVLRAKDVDGLLLQSAAAMMLKMQATGTCTQDEYQAAKSLAERAVEAEV